MSSISRTRAARGHTQPPPPHPHPALGLRDGLRWTLVTIGLTEDASQYEARGYTATRSAIGYTTFRRFGMPFQITPKPRLSATSPACRVIVATRLIAPELQTAAFRALQFARFTTTGVIEDRATLRGALATVDGLDGDAIVARIDDLEVIAAYEEDRARARTAAGSPTEFQGRAANTDGLVRYTAPSLVFESATGAAWRPAASSRWRPMTWSSPISKRGSSAGPRR